MIANPDDEVSLTRIVNVPTRGIGDAAVKQMQAHAVGNGVGLWAAMQRSREIPGLSARAINSVSPIREIDRIVPNARQTAPPAPCVRSWNW